MKSTVEEHFTIRGSVDTEITLFQISFEEDVTIIDLTGNGELLIDSCMFNGNVVLKSFTNKSVRIRNCRFNKPIELSLINSGEIELVNNFYLADVTLVSCKGDQLFTSWCSFVEQKSLQLVDSIFAHQQLFINSRLNTF